MTKTKVVKKMNSYTQVRILTDTETKELIRAAQGGDEEAKDRLIYHNSRLVRKVVVRLGRPIQDQEDLFQLGLMGLLKAIESFDFSFPVKFSTYAVPKVKGEITRWLRDHGQYFKAPRAVNVVSQKIHAMQMYDDTPEDIMDILEVKDKEVVESALKLSKMQMRSLDKAFKIGEESESTLKDIIDGDINNEWFEMIAFRDSFKVLNDRELKVIKLRYIHDIPQRDIAPVIGCSQVHVSRIEKKALEKLRESYLTTV